MNNEFIDQLLKIYIALLRDGYIIHKLKKIGINTMVAYTGFGNKIYPITGFIPKTFCYITRSRCLENIEILNNIKNHLEGRDLSQTIVQLKIRGNQCVVICTDFMLSDKVEFKFKFTSLNKGI